MTRYYIWHMDGFVCIGQYVSVSMYGEVCIGQYVQGSMYGEVYMGGWAAVHGCQLCTLLD